jgi:hypothetical protein
MNSEAFLLFSFGGLVGAFIYGTAEYFFKLGGLISCFFMVVLTIILKNIETKEKKKR